MATTTKDYTVEGTDGNEYKVTLTADPSAHVEVASVEPLSGTDPIEPPIEPPTEPPVEGDIPLDWDHESFDDCSNSGCVTVSNGKAVENKSITETGHTASITMGSGGGKALSCRVSSREGVRIGGSGNFEIDGCYLEATGQGDDHADTIQHYSPGSRGTLTLTNSTIRAHNQAATAGLFCADNWTGTFDISNVVFHGGPFGLRLHPDTGGDNIIRLRDVFFVGPFGYHPYEFGNYGGHRNIFEVWENVRHATIDADGNLVPGNAIPKPSSTEVHAESMTKEKAVKEMK